MLADPDSKIIRAFGILNDTVARNTPYFGVPYPGTFVIDEHAVVRSKFFQDNTRDRYTASGIVVRQFGDTDGLHRTVAETAHLKLSYASSDVEVQSGSRIALVLDIELKPRIHLYAPGVTGGYIPIAWNLPASKSWRAEPVSYPPAHKLHLPVIRETVPVYVGHLRLVRELSLGEIENLKSLVVDGSLRYQACDDKECYPPQTVPLKWTFRVAPEDRQRVPVPLRKPGDRRNVPPDSGPAGAR